MDTHADPDHNMTNTPTQDPTSSADYRAVLGKVPTSVAVIAAMNGDEPIGVSVGSFVSVSLAPPLVGFFIAHNSSTWPLIEPTGGFCASLLSVDHESVCRLFATKGADRFARRTSSSSPSGKPIIDGSVAWLDCTIDSTTDAGDHRLVLGRIDAMDAAEDRDPLVFLGGRYGQFTPFDPSNSFSD